MENNNEILNELQNISSVVAATITKLNVFSVPDGYFDTIADTVLISVAEESPLNDISFHLKETDVPAGYFDDLPSLILTKIKNQEEELPAIFSSINKDQLFSVPGNYFQTLSENILNKIKTQVGESVAGEEYLSPVLSELKKENPFYIPQNYFENFPDDLLKKIKEQNNARVIAMPRRNISIFKYAAAAVITGALALGVYKYSDQTQSITNPSVTTASVKLDPSIEKGKVMDEQKFNETLNSLSADDISNYLQRNSSETDIAALSSNTEGTSLPNEEDYLLDDKTLDNFLKELETKTN